MDMIIPKETMADAKHQIKYATKTNNSLAKDLTVFVGLVVDKVLDIGILHHAAKELVTQWPILGGQLVTKVTILKLTPAKSILTVYRQILTPSKPAIELTSSHERLPRHSMKSFPSTFTLSILSYQRISTSFEGNHLTNYSILTLYSF
jgi:hypothetical protein